jgi:hypothetical protein
MGLQIYEIILSKQVDLKNSGTRPQKIKGIKKPRITGAFLFLKMQTEIRHHATFPYAW